MAAALNAGLAYFAIVFAVGFAFGTMRVLVLVPRVGEIGGVLAELPVMLSVSWFVCAWLVGMFTVPRKWRERLAMGAFAFALMMTAELGVSVLAFDRSVAAHIGTYRSWEGILGLAAQLFFAAAPLLHRKRACPSQSERRLKM